MDALFIKEGDTVGEVRIGGDRSGFIIAGGNNRENAVKLACEAEENICFIYKSF